MATKKKATKKKKETKKKKTTGKRKTAKQKRGGNILQRMSAVQRIAALLAAAAVITAVVFGAAQLHGKRTPVAYKFNKSRAYGIDVSAHNGKIDWGTVAKEVDFAFIRVGCRGYEKGNIFLDKRAAYNMKNAEKAGVPYGVYIYSQAISEAEAREEAKFLLKHIKARNVHLPLVLDFEYPTKDGKPIGRMQDAQLTKKERTQIINAFCQTVKEAGYTPALYASSYIYRSYIQVGKLEDGTVIWVADYNSKVTYYGHYDIWQFSETGTCPGVSSKYVDTDYWYTNEKDG